MTATPSFASSRGSRPRSSEALLTTPLMGISSSCRRMSTPDFLAMSFSAPDTPPLVGSFMAVTPPTSSAPSIIPQRGATSDSTGASSLRPSLDDMRAS